MASTWSTGTNEHKNYTKLCRLLYDGGSEAVRSVFDVYCPPSSLVATLKSYETRLRNLKKPRLNNNQLDKLYPPSGPSPTSKDFDITLLFVLLRNRNICPGVTPPTTGWNDLPLPGDSSDEANLVRIKFYRNNVIAHRPSAKVDDTLFETYWKEISTPLLSLGIKQDDIDQLKSAPLGEVDYSHLLNEWSQSDEDIKSQLVGIKSDTAEIKCSLEEMKNQIEADIRRDSPISKLVCSDFDSVVSSLVKSYHPNTRQWVFEEVRSYLEKKQSGSTMFVIEAGPGMGKSVVAAKICDMYKDSEDIILGACHFFKHNNILRNDPRLMLQSIARQLCLSVPGYNEALERNLQASVEKIPELGCKELFTLLLEEPSCKLNPKDTVVVVIDALDECNDRKNELCRAFDAGIPHLPSWLRFVITTRPPPSISSFRTGNHHNHIKPDDSRNKQDLDVFFNEKLKELGKVSSVDERHIKDLIDTTKGIFLVAFFVIDYLTTKSSDSLSEIIEYFPKGNGMTSVYEDYLNRLKKALLPYIKSEEGFFHMLDAIVEAKFPIEKKMFYDILGLDIDAPRVPIPEREEAIHLLHQLFPVENEHVSAFHKTIIDWLTTGDHYFRVKDTKDVLANQCYEVLTDIKQGLKNLEKPPSISSSERYAIVLGGDYMESPTFDNEKRVETQTNCFLLCLWLLEQLWWDWNRHPYGTDNTLGFATVNQKTIYQKCKSHFYARFCHWQDCPFYQRKTLKQKLEPILQVLHLLDINSEIKLTPKPIDLLKEYGLPYNEMQIIMKKPEDRGFLHPYNHHDMSQSQLNAIPTSSVEILPCFKAFFLVQYPAQKIRAQEKITLIQKYQLDGTLVIEETFQEHKKLFMSPDNQFIVAIPVFTKENIEIIDATTLKMHTSYTSPNVIRSCHVYGCSQSWYILIRCFNNKIYVMEAETGNIIHQPVDIDQFDDVEAVGSLGHFVLGRKEKAPPYCGARSTKRVFTDQKGNFFDEMIYDHYRQDDRSIVRKLYLCHFNEENQVIKMPIYPQKAEILCNCFLPRSWSLPGSSQMLFSDDGRLFAFSYINSTTVLNTSDGSIYCSVLHEVGSHQIVCLTKDIIIFHDGDGFLTINLETKQSEHGFSARTGSYELPDPIRNERIVPGFDGREKVFLAMSFQDKPNYIYKHSIFDLLH